MKGTHRVAATCRTDQGRGQTATEVRALSGNQTRVSQDRRPMLLTAEPNRPGLLVVNELQLALQWPTGWGWISQGGAAASPQSPGKEQYGHRPAWQQLSKSSERPPNPECPDTVPVQSALPLPEPKVSGCGCGCFSLCPGCAVEPPGSVTRGRRSQLRPLPSCRPWAPSPVSRLRNPTRIESVSLVIWSSQAAFLLQFVCVIVVIPVWSWETVCVASVHSAAILES
uniref:Uncharacterized protein n=1 Tax=Molossus molossus TaxID=27622 RepID=A0A7J8F8W5_MOLMO|nr:hypothetical protein HJG59_008514 [Molossus molossus]